jgi:hypothetical protein
MQHCRILWQSEVVGYLKKEAGNILILGILSAVQNSRDKLEYDKEAVKECIISLSKKLLNQWKSIHMLA